MTSFKADKIIHDWSTFKVQGQLYHKLGSLLPEKDIEEKFLQIYFISDFNKQAQLRCNISPETKENIVRDIQQYLSENNLLIRNFKSAWDNGMRNNPDNFDIVICADKAPPGHHAGRYNAPVVDEVSAVITGLKHGRRDIVIKHREGQLTSIQDTNHAYDALQYPLIYTMGEDGYDFGIAIVDEDKNPIINKGKKRYVTAMNYYAYMLMIRDDETNHLHKSKNLFLQFLVDIYVKIENERINYIKYHQDQLRVVEYEILKEAVENNKDTDIGKPTIMPSSFVGSDRWWHNIIQDGLTYTITHGPPDLFLTLTCNAKWDEITRELFPGQTAKDRPDLVARVFKLKVMKIMDLLKKHAVFGTMKCYMYSIEWQKRGLPHVHILLWLKEKIQPSQIDLLISAEIPDPTLDPELYKCVTTHMIHGPCHGPLAHGPRKPCMKEFVSRNGLREYKCTKKYPRECVKDTKTDQDGYPLYKRRKPEDGGHVFTKEIGSQHVKIDNGWVVPYSPFLLRAFNCHINVEMCNGVRSIKYICKYINKGSDMATFAMRNKETDEIKTFLTGRWVNSNEGAWRTFSFKIADHHPPVICLEVHLENGERVFFNKNTARQIVQEKPKTTTLTGFFELNKVDPEARSLYYFEVPSHYTWKSGKWAKRVRGGKDTLFRVYGVSPHHSDCFHLRLLLFHVIGPQSFEDLRKVEGRICSTYQEACEERGLLDNDAQWEATVKEDIVFKSPSTLRNIFSLLISECLISKPQILWEKYKVNFAEDILLKHRRSRRDPILEYNENIFNEALILIEDKVLSLGKNNLNRYGLKTN